MLAVNLVASVVLADVVSGLVHWFEDVYVHRDMPLLGKWLHKVAEDNRLHHDKPRAFLAKTWWQSSWDLVLLGSLVLLCAWWLGMLSLPVWVFVVLSINANQMHKWTHQNSTEKGWLVHRLQKLRLLQTPRAHAHHHQGAKNSHYCVITNFMNPVLEKLHFWRRLEWLLAHTIGLKPHMPKV
jgi:plasmanylethanolamine desaturase